MYRFMIMEQKITIKFNGSPLRRDFPEIFNERYIREKNGEKKEWLTALPKFDLGTVTMKGKKVKINEQIINTNRVVGTMLSHEVTKATEGKGLAEDTIKVKLKT